MPAAGFDEDTVLHFAGCLERSSEHPLAAAIVRTAGERKIALADPEDFESVTGQGVRGRIDNRNVVLGSAGFMNAGGVVLAELSSMADE